MIERPESAAWLHKTSFIGEDDRLDAVAQAELREDVRDVSADRRLGDEEPGRHLPLTCHWQLATLPLATCDPLSPACAYCAEEVCAM